MKNQYIKFDTSQKKSINKFFAQYIISDIKNSVGEIIGQNYEFSENVLCSTLDLVIRHCKKKAVFITSYEVKDLLKKSNKDSFVENLNDLFKDELTVIIPNNILFLSKGVEDFNFGDAIKCLPSSQIKEQINQVYANED